jgi:hypothetical protein
MEHVDQQPVHLDVVRREGIQGRKVLRVCL